ncbi:MAG: 23S rRNA pseudouridine(955/2504/2580) synthase [Piscirickettsiaceae bacterium]|nr:MAG: 23S rRNA pseudouridine(955/2504/2580) synthase [Piscirickettsiaceae bacterium]
MKTELQHTVQFVEVDENAEGQRLDNFLMSRLKGVPKGHIYKIIRRGEVRINKGRAKNVYRLQVGDVVRIPPVKVDNRHTEAPSVGVLATIESRIIFEDGDLIVLNKPSGIAVHGGTAINFGAIDAVRALRKDDSFIELIHRIDKATSGCLLIAKNRKMLNAVQGLLRSRHVKKTYTALLLGVQHQKTVTVSAPLEKRTLKSGEHRVRVHPQGKPSQTEFTRLCTYKRTTLVSASPKTGRTHQIRVHAKHLGRPIAGDERYSTAAQYKHVREQGLKRLFLHASEISFEHPVSNKQYAFKAPLDSALENYLETL